MGAAAVPLGGPVYRIPTLGDFINSFAFVEDDGSVTLVDCGIHRAPPRIVAGLAALGKHPRDVQRIILTHAHADHAGGAAEIVRQSAAGGVLAHADDAGFLTSGQGSPGSESSPMYRVLRRLGAFTFEPVDVVGELADEDTLDVAGGLVVHHTPGHTAGHVSLLHPDTGVMITGDALFNFTGRISWPFASACMSLPLTKQTAHVLGELDYTLAAFTHGPELREGAREKIRSFLATHS